MRMRTAGLAVALCAALAFPSAALAATASAPTTPTSTPAPNAKEREYNLDFTLPTEGKSGCQVCHADPNLVKPSGDTTSSIYIDPAAMAETAHKDTPCSGCHIDFAYKTPHDNVQDGADWQAVAGQACKNCHPDQYTSVALGAHSPADKPGVDASETAAVRREASLPTEVPTCGDCHGSHDIDYIDVAGVEASGTAEAVAAAEAGQAELHGRGLEMCGQCHADYADSYNDYYHGAAYREGTADAPACWDCHGAHEMLAASDRRSPVHPDNLSKTCGQQGCHEGDVDERFSEYAQLIHGMDEVEDTVVLISFIDVARARMQGVFDAVASWF